MASCLRHSAPDRLRIGTLTAQFHDGGPDKITDLVCCIHCGQIFNFGPGMTKGRGWCMKCNGYLCGDAHCRGRPCQHWMFGIENMEAGRPEDAPKPIAVSVTAAPPGG